MVALVSSRLLYIVGDSLPLLRFSQVTKSASFCSSVRLSSRSDRTNGSLTLASVGFRSELETKTKSTPKGASKSATKSTTKSGTQSVIKNNEDDDYSRLQEVVSFPRTKAKPLAKAVVKKPLEFESAPFSAKSFSELGLPDSLISRLESVGFTIPTDVQSAAIPTILKNHDVVVQSYTGSGKTLAYLLPILAQVVPLRKESLEGEKSKKKTDIEAVIVAPSRELGMQIFREVEKLLGPDDKKMVQQLVGGANRSRQEEALKKNKPAIVVGTPGRIAEISAAGKLQTHSCRYLVLDEVDQLLSFNFREDMHRILEHVGRKYGSEKSIINDDARQTIMVSATVPFSVIRAARSWGQDPVLVRAGQVLPLEPVNSPSDIDTSIGNLPPGLKHYYCVSRMQHKIDTLRRCIYALDAKTVIAFMNNTRQLKDTVFKLEARGVEAAELHGDLGKLARSTVLSKFKKGELRVLVTNELSARGLDVSECDLVVNLDLPTDTVHYAHRAGRAGRLGRKGWVVSICEEREVFIIKKMEKALGVSVESCEFTEGKIVVNEENKKV